MPQKKWKPEEYDEQCILQYNTAMSMLDTLSLRGDEKILDVGCGTGKISLQMAKERVPNGCVLGVDINAAMIEFAKTHNSRENLSYGCEDILTFDKENYFDIAVSFWTLSWIPMKDQIKALNNIIRSLNEDGKLFLMYPMRHDAYDVVDAVIKMPRWQEYFVGYSMPRAFITEQLYKNAIISKIPMIITVEKKEIECCYKDDKEMMDSINCWLAHVDEIPEPEDKQEFLKDVVKAYKIHRGISTPTMYYSTLEMTGEKYTFENVPEPRFKCCL
jgi:ubiquinone/menaquinone biosynthesis C-methylase UbiE